MQVDCQVDDVELENDAGREVDGVRVICLRCDHSVECFGRSGRSVRRALALLREECPNGEENFYKAEDDRDED